MRKLAVALALLTAVCATLGSIYVLIDSIESTHDLLIFFGLQALSSALLSVVTAAVLPAQWRKPKAAVYALLFCFGFFIPLFGAAGMLIAVALTLLLPKRWRYEDFSEVAPVAYSPLERDSGTQLRISSLRTALLDTSAPSDVRMRSLVAMHTMPMRIVGPLIRRLLGDASDDLRLVAYGMLDSEEKRINAMIASEQENLEKDTGRMLRANSLRHLAELHWELVYSGLVQGDVRDYAIASALRYLSEALNILREDSGLWMLRGRLLQTGGDFAAAEEAFNLAVSCGLEQARALPYLAELAFARRQFALLRYYIGLIASRQVTPVMAPVVRFWLGSNAAVA